MSSTTKNLEKENSEASTKEKEVENREKYKEAIRYLSSYKDKPTEASSDQNLITAISTLKDVYVEFDNFDAELQNSFYETITKLIETECSAIINETQQNEKEKHIKLLRAYLDVLNSYTFQTESFKLRFKKQDECIKKLLELSENLYFNFDSSRKHLTNKLVGSILLLIFHLTETSFSYEKDWKHLNLLDSVLKIGNFDVDTEVKSYCATIILSVYDFNEQIYSADNGEELETEDSADDEGNDIEESADKQKSEIEDGESQETLGESIQHLLNYSDKKNMIKDHQCLEAFHYIWEFVENMTDDKKFGDKPLKEIVYEELFKESFLKVIFEFLRVNYDDLTESLKASSGDTNSLSDEAHYKAIKYFTYTNNLLEKLVLSNLRYETSMKLMSINGIVDLLMNLLKNNELNDKVINNTSPLLFHVHSKFYENVLWIFHRLLTVSNMYKESFKSINNTTLFEVAEMSKKLELKSIFMMIMPALLEYSDDADENQLILLKEYNKSKLDPESEESFQIYVNSIKYLTESFTPEKTLDSRKVLDVLDYHFSVSNYHYEKLDDELKKKYAKFIINYIRFAHTTIIKDLKSMKFNLKKHTFDEIDIKIIKLNSLVNLLLASGIIVSSLFTDFNSLFHENDENSIASILKFISDDYIISTILKEHENNVVSFLTDYLFTGLIRFFHSISEVAYLFRDKWTQLNAYKILLNLGNRLADVDNDLRVVCFMTLANCATDDDLANFSSSIAILDSIMEILKIFANTLEDRPDEIQREKFQLDVKDKEKVEMIVTEDWKLSEIIHGLYQFAVNDSIKPLLYFNLSGKEYLLKIVYNGNEIEQEYAIKLLNQLCFDKKVAQDVAKDTALMNFLKDKLAKKTEKTRKRLIKYIEAILWLIEKDHKPSDVANKTSSKDGTKQIMISYNSESRKYCLDIKKYLESIGFKVWIDVENIHGSSIDAMANAVESSWAILVCMTEKYKDSANCRLEAEYVAQLKKPFIPLIMQKSYKPRGWLGMLLGAKIFIDFTKYDFEECSSRLIKEINGLENIPIALPLAESKTKTEKTKPVEAAAEKKKQTSDMVEKFNTIAVWKESEVENWFNKNNIASTIKDLFQSFNGKHLVHLYRVFTNCPDFFYKTLKTDTSANLREIVVFADELQTLFTGN